MNHSATRLAGSLLVALTTLSLFAPPATAAQLPAPMEVSTRSGDSTIALSWSAVPGAVQYQVYRATGSGWTLITMTPSLTFTDSPLRNGAVYYYRVAGFNTDGRGQLSRVIRAMPMAAPSGVTATPGDRQVTVSWRPSIGALSYTVFRSTSNAGPFAPVASSLTALTHVDAALMNGVTYFYRVQGVGGYGSSPMSLTVSAIPKPPAPNVPPTLSAVPGDAKVALSWTVVPNATSYKIFRSTTAVFGAAPLTTVAATSYTDTPLTNGTLYSYRVVASNDTGDGPPSTVVTATPNPSAPNTAPTLSGTPADGQVKLSWTAVTGATGYRIFRTTTGVFGNAPLISVNGTSHIDTGLTNGTPYMYRVLAYNAGGNGPPSNVVTVTPAAGAPSTAPTVSAVGGNSQVMLSWNAIAGASGYRIFRSTPGVPFGATPLASVPGTSHTDASLPNGTTFVYAVLAYNAGGNGPLSAPVTATTTPVPAAPSSSSATPGDGQVTVSWPAVAGATGYNVFRSLTSGVYGTTPAGTVSASPFVDNGLQNGTRYFYVVVATNAVGSSPRSPESSATPVGSAPNLDVVSAARVLRQATWGPRPGDIERVRQLGLNGFMTEQLGMAPSTYPIATLKDMGIEAGQEYFMNLTLTGQDQLRQRVAWALHKMWVVSAVEVEDVEGILTYHQTLLNNAFSNYRTLMKAMTLNPAMGRYLNMLNSRKQTPGGPPPNENYPRELLQLFTIGLNRLTANGTPQLDANGVPIRAYTEDDVKALARLFTGWTWGDGNPATPPDPGTRNWLVPMEPLQTRHDVDAKVFLGETFLPGGAAAAELDRALDIIFNHPNVGFFVGSQLIKSLVMSNPSTTYVRDIAAVFANNGGGVRGDMAAVVRAILTHPEARSVTADAGKLTEPVLFITSLVRALNATVTTQPFMTDWAEEMGQKVFFPPSVFSYFSPNFRVRGTVGPGGAPLVGPEFQIHTTVTALQRANFVGRLLAGWFDNEISVDYAPFTSIANNAAALVDLCNLRFMGNTMTAADREEIIRVLGPLGRDERTRTAIYLTLVIAQSQVVR